MARDYTKNKAWQLSDKLAIMVYNITGSFPRSEIFGLTSQIRRTAVSVPANIRFSKEIGYLDRQNFDDLNSLYEQTIRTLRALINFIEKSKVKGLKLWNTYYIYLVLLESISSSP